MIHEAEENLAQKRKEMSCMYQEQGKYNNNGNLNPVACSGPDTIPDSNGIISSNNE